MFADLLFFLTNYLIMLFC